MKHFLETIKTTLKKFFHDLATSSFWKKIARLFKPIKRLFSYEKQSQLVKASLIVGGLAVGFLTLWLVGRLGGLIARNACVYILEEGGPSQTRKGRIVSVEGQKVSLGTVAKRIQTVGQLQPNQIVTLKAEIHGRIAKIHVKEGAHVDEGDMLLQFDDSDTKAALEEAEALLLQKEAAFKRSEELKAKNIQSTKDYDEAKAGLAMARAKVDSAKANLAKTQIKAPFAGHVGLIEQSPGAYVQAGTEIATIVDNNPMKVNFKIPERNSHEIGVGQAIDLRLDGFPDQSFQASVEAIDSRIQSESHSISVRGTIANEKGLLVGGLFCNIHLIVGEEGDSILIDEAALEREGDIEFVWTVVRGKAQRQRVLVGMKEKGKVEIISGLTPGQIVVIAGQMHLGSDGQPVNLTNINEDGTPKKTEDSSDVEQGDKEKGAKDKSSDNKPNDQNTTEEKKDTQTSPAPAA